MTDTVDRLATPSRASEWLDLVARTDGPDGLTKMNSPSDESSPSVTPAGGQDDFSHQHTGPHVYIVYWPDLAILKVGVSKAQRWRSWRGMVEIAVLHTCCMEHARTLERWMLDRVRPFGAQISKAEGQQATGRGGGYTECVRLVQSPRKGELVMDPWDWERAYGLILPAEFASEIGRLDFARHPVIDMDDDVALAAISARAVALERRFAPSPSSVVSQVKAVNG